MKKEMKAKKEKEKCMTCDASEIACMKDNFD